MNHFIHDYETLGQNPINCVLVNCAYFIFDSDRFLTNNPYTHEELITTIKLDKFSVEDQKNAGYVIDPDTVKWWMKQDEEVRKQCLPSKVDISRIRHTHNIKDYITNQKISRWWTRGNTFDPVILKELDDKAMTGIFEILRFWNVRDIRTFVDTKFNFKSRSDFNPFEDNKKWNKIFKKHNSVHDVSADILRMQQIFRAENGLSLVDR